MTAPPIRLGPLPLHLEIQTMTWLSSRAALLCLSNGPLNWRLELAEAVAALGKTFAASILTLLPVRSMPRPAAG